jgi:hypothetical protein
MLPCQRPVKPVTVVIAGVVGAGVETGVGDAGLRVAGLGVSVGDGLVEATGFGFTNSGCGCAGEADGVGRKAGGAGVIMLVGATVEAGVAAILLAAGKSTRTTDGLLTMRLLAVCKPGMTDGTADEGFTTGCTTCGLGVATEITGATGFVRVATRRG